MVEHRVYGTIVNAVCSGRLVEPFRKSDFINACPGLGNGTYRAFLWKHREGNLGCDSVLFVKVGTGLFKLKRPLKYGFVCR